MYSLFFFFYQPDVDPNDFVKDDNDIVDNVAGVVNQLRIGLSQHRMDARGKRKHLQQRLAKMEDETDYHLDNKAQSKLDYIADHLDIRYNVISNEGGRYHVDLVLTNTGTKSIESCCFAIYFAHMK